MDQIEEFWRNRSNLDEFLWDDLSALNAALTQQYLKPNSKILDLGCGDGASTRHLTAQITLVDYVRPKNLVVPTNGVFIQEDLRRFQTTEKYDLITLYGVANSFPEQEIAQIYHQCYGWLSPGGTLLVKHQCGKNEDVFVDKFSERLQSNYCAYYHSVDHHAKMLRRAGFEPKIIDPYPLDKNKCDNTVFKAFICQHKSPMSYIERFTSEYRFEIEKKWFEMHARREHCPANLDARLEILRVLKAKLDEYDIPLYLMYGTLLGAMREGDFIPWDTDVDVAILGRFQDRFAEIVKSIPPLKLLRIGDYYCSLMYLDEFIDIYSFTEQGQKYSYCNGERAYFDEEKVVFDKPSVIPFKGMEFLTVNDPNASLARWYGADWRTPKPKRILSTNPNKPDNFH